MNEPKNPFEEAMKASEIGFDPFAPATADMFGKVPLRASPPIDPGSQPEVKDPFETSDGIPAGTVEQARKAAPVIDLGNQPGAAISFAEQEPAIAPVKEIQGGQLNMLGPEPEADVPDADLQTDDPEIENPLSAAMDKAEQTSIFVKPPIFEYGAVREAIENQEQTFEDLRIAKADDFPELEDSVRVSWDVTYGKIRKSVPTPKKTKIGEFKKSIESSKEFMATLKKDTNKSPDCVIKPRITAQSKGDIPAYKGVFTTLEDAETAGKVISIVPGSDGKVYEIRREEMGTFITPSGQCRELSEIKAGFTPALSPIPRERLLEIISFFRSLMSDEDHYEAIVNIYWDRKREAFIAVIPKQRVTAVKADSELTDDYGPARYLHYIDVHSHNVMPARFSAQDDRDEKATRLYAVIGKLDRPIPEMSVRIANGGKHLLIDPAIVFESSADYYPVEWDKRLPANHLTCAAEKLVQSIARAFEYEGAMCA